MEAEARNPQPRKRRLPKGTSDYQAAWILDDRWVGVGGGRPGQARPGWGGRTRCTHLKRAVHGSPPTAPRLLTAAALCPPAAATWTTLTSKATARTAGRSTAAVAAAATTTSRCLAWSPTRGRPAAPACVMSTPAPSLAWRCASLGLALLEFVRCRERGTGPLACRPGTEPPAPPAPPLAPQYDEDEEARAGQVAGMAASQKEARRQEEDDQMFPDEVRAVPAP